VVGDCNTFSRPNNSAAASTSSAASARRLCTRSEYGSAPGTGGALDAAAELPWGPPLASL